MDQAYQDRLAEVAGNLPDRPTAIVLIPTLPLDQAAALANDLAQTIGSRRSGHTILTSFESPPSHLDHEIGAEGTDGLTEVLSQRTTLARAAAHGRARRFIYVPAGPSAVRGDVLLRSEAWRALSRTALEGGGTLLAFAPPEVLVAAGEGRVEGTTGARFDGVVWLGPITKVDESVRRASIDLGGPNFGVVLLPTAPRPDVIVDVPAPGKRKPISGREVVMPDPPGRRAPSRSPRPVVGMVRRGRSRAAQRRAFWRTVAIVLLLGVLGLAAVYVIGTTATADADGPDAEFAAPER